MIGILSDLVSPGQVGVWLVIAILVVYFFYKEWPEFKRRITSGALKEQQEEEEDRTVGERLDSIEKEIKQVNQKLERDYYRLNEFETKLRRTRDTQADINQELEIIMRALIGVLKGLQEQGANGPTRSAEQEIQAYLTKKAHANKEEE